VAESGNLEKRTRLRRVKGPVRVLTRCLLMGDLEGLKMTLIFCLLIRVIKHFYFGGTLLSVGLKKKLVEFLKA
jgi:hypothetical protein